MDDLLPFYERELARVRRDSGEFAARYPRIAGQLQRSGDGPDDPHVERLIQACALLAARIGKRLDDGYPQLTESLFESLYPHYLRAFPSASIARIDAGATAAAAIRHIARDTPLQTAPVHGVCCQFRTAYDAVVAPVVIEQARFAPLADDAVHAQPQSPPPSLLPAGAASAIAITIATPAAHGLAGLGLARLRVFLDGDASFCAALRDTLLLRTVGACVAADDGRWHALDRAPLSAVGFADDEGLVPLPARSHPAYRLLTEYFAFPDKFNFIDFDLAAMTARLPAGAARCTLYLALRHVRAGDGVARALAALSPHKLLLNCVPIVNLFPRAAVPVEVTQRAPDYALLADARQPYAYEIHAIDSASLISGDGRQVRALQPFYSLRHGRANDGGYWIARRDAATARCSPGHELRVALVGVGLAELVQPRGGAPTLSAQLTCSNRDLPAALACGAPHGDLAMAGGDGTPVRLLRKPTPSLRRAAGHDEHAGNDAHWRLVAHLALDRCALPELDVDALRKLLTLYDLPASPVTQRQIAGIAALSCQAVMAWMPGQPCAALMPGLDVRMTLDEAAFTGSGIYAFAQVIERVLALYAPVNVFVALVVLSAHGGEELLRCPPRSGKSSLT